MRGRDGIEGINGVETGGSDCDPLVFVACPTRTIKAKTFKSYSEMLALNPVSAIMEKFNEKVSRCAYRVVDDRYSCCKLDHSKRHASPAARRCVV